VNGRDWEQLTTAKKSQKDIKMHLSMFIFAALPFLVSANLPQLGQYGKKNSGAISSMQETHTTIITTSTPRGFAEETLNLVLSPGGVEPKREMIEIV
jgi:hypothetical protein